MTLFKIRDPLGRYSTGGAFPRWTSKGKTWSGPGPLKNHLNQFVGGHSPYVGCEVVAVEVVEAEAAVAPVAEVLAGCIERNVERWKPPAAGPNGAWARSKVAELEAQLAKVRAELAGPTS